MKILFLASECAPFIKTGGLADVVGSLPVALAERGHDVRVMIPCYSCIPAEWRDRMEETARIDPLFGWKREEARVLRLVDRGVTWYFIDAPSRFSVYLIYGDGMAEAERFAFFCRAALDSLDALGFFPDVLHCNDWQTGLVPALLKAQYAFRPGYGGIRTVFSVHNLRYQGIFSFRHLNGALGFPEDWFTPDKLEFYGCLNCMKTGLVFADRVSTVSPTYAHDIMTPEGGDQLDGVLRARGDGVTGIVNGIDTVSYDPEHDPWIRKRYTAADFAEGKAACKAALQEEMGLSVRTDVPLIGMITRLADQKGLDLVHETLHGLVDRDIQFVFLGSGERRYIEFLGRASETRRGNVAFRCALDERLAHRIYAGADLFLMPSAFEPCGLSQLIAQRYGCVPIVRETGGLKDTVRPYNRFTGEGDGFTFSNYSAADLGDAVLRAVDVYRNCREAMDGLIRSGMEKDFTWLHSAAEYERLYALAAGDRAAVKDGPKETASEKPMEKPQKAPVKKAKAAGRKKPAAKTKKAD